MFLADWRGAPTTTELTLPSLDHTFTLKREAEAADFQKVLQEALHGEAIPRTPSGIMPGHEFMWLLQNCTGYFAKGPTRVRGFTGEISKLLACMLEDTACKVGAEVEIFERGLLRVASRDAEQDPLFRKTQELLKVLFGKARFQGWQEGRKILFEPVEPSGQDAFINERKNYLLKNLSQVTRAPRDATARHKLLCKDGWYWDYGLKAWVQNSIDARLWRVAGKTRAQLDDRELVPDDLRELIATFWAEVGRYEQAGGKNIDDDDEHDKTAVTAAYDAVLLHPKSRPGTANKVNKANQFEGKMNKWRTKANKYDV